MKIYLNDQAIDFELNQEKTLGEVLNSLETWAQGQKHFLGEVRVDDRRVDIEEESERRRPWKEIKTLHCEILSAVAYAVSVWVNLRFHLEPFKAITPEIATQKIDDISARLEWVKKIIVRLDSFFETPEENQSLIQQIKDLELGIFQLKTQPQNLDKVTGLLKLIDNNLEKGLFKLNLKILKAGLKDDLLSVRNSIENYLVFLDLLDEKLLEVATVFQKSQFKSAIRELPVIVEGLGIFFVLNRQIDHCLDQGGHDNEKKSRQKLVEDLEGFLHGLEEGIKNNDYIEVADIIEYEIKEMIPSVKDALEKISVTIEQVEINQ